MACLPVRACLYDPGIPGSYKQASIWSRYMIHINGSVYRDLSLLIIYCYFWSCVYMETGTSRLTEIPVEATEIRIKRDKLCPCERNIPVHWDEVKWNLKWRLTRENLQKNKAKRNNIRWDAIYANKISFRFIDKLLYQRFHAFLNEIDTSRSPETSWCTEII